VGSEDPGALAGAMRQILDNPGQAQSYLNAATSRLETHFGRVAWIGSYERLYHRILAR
jgi:hypothetical protein